MITINYYNLTIFQKDLFQLEVLSVEAMGTKKKIDNFMKEINNEKDWENLFEYQV